MKTKKEMRDLCRSILHKYPIDNELGYAKITNKGEHDFLIDLFENHPQWPEKAMKGIDFISVILTEWKNRCFQLHRTDGTTTDISYKACIDGKKPIVVFAHACRNAVRYDINKFREDNVIYGVTTCEITGEILRKENTHIDHYDMDFKSLVYAFYDKYFSEYDINYVVDNFINKTEDNSVDTYFLGTIPVRSYGNNTEEVGYLFKIFHNKNTHLRPITKEANTSILRKKVAPVQ